jgi:hypothetical protein
MAQYRFLADCYVNGGYINAGDVVTLSNSFVPPAAVDPLDAAGAQAYFNAGPQLVGLIRPQWSTQVVAAPVTRWVPGPGAWQWSLTGLGASLGPTSGGPLGLP